MNYKEYIHPELLVLVPVLYLIGAAIKKSNMKDSCIPFVLGLLGVIMSAASVFATSELGSAAQVFGAIFTSVTQGVLIAGTAVYSNQLYIQAKKGRTGADTKNNNGKGINDGNV